MTGINLKVLSCHFSHKTGSLAAEGDYRGAARYANSCIRDLEEDDFRELTYTQWLASNIDSIG